MSKDSEQPLLPKGKRKGIKGYREVFNDMAKDDKVEACV